MEIDRSSWGTSPFLILLRMPTRNVESGMSKMKREQGVNDLPQKEHVFRSFRQISYKNETKFLLFFTSHPKNIDSLLTTWVYFLLRK
jgi:hypothetical protein